MFEGPDPLVPVVVDVTHDGARVRDSFLWRLKSESMTPDEFAFRTCCDLGLPQGFQPIMAAQLVEQIRAYRELLAVCIGLAHVTKDDEAPASIRPGPELLQVAVDVRKNTVHYMDTFAFDQFDPSFSPEQFARATVADESLPYDMEAAIAFRIRECTMGAFLQRLGSTESFGSLCGSAPFYKCTDEAWRVHTSSLSSEGTAGLTSAITTRLTGPGEAYNMLLKLWQKDKPVLHPGFNDYLVSSGREVQPQTTKKLDNAHVWVAHA
jgi:hypothetical protein